MAPGKVVYKICKRSDWLEAEGAGSLAGSAGDRRDGFIHLSTGAQIAETVAKHFGGEDDLMILGVDANKIASGLKWERSRGGALFPHLYAPLGIEAVVWARPLPLGQHGRHQLLRTRLIALLKRLLCFFNFHPRLQLGGIRRTG